MTKNENQLHLQLLKADLIKSSVSCKELIQEIHEHSGSQNELDSLALLVRAKINKLNDQIGELTKHSLEHDDIEEKNILDSEINQWKKQLQDEHHIFRNALLSAQLAITQRNKDELFGNLQTKDENLPVSSVRHRDKMSRNIMVKRSSQLSDDLLTVTRMIKDNTEKSAKTLDLLVESSQTITTTQEELKTTGSMIGQARKILNKYGRRENTDKLLIFLGLVFFLASCLVVIRNRF